MFGQYKRIYDDEQIAIDTCFFTLLASVLLAKGSTQISGLHALPGVLLITLFGYLHSDSLTHPNGATSVPVS